MVSAQPRRRPSPAAAPAVRAALTPLHPGDRDGTALYRQAKRHLLGAIESGHFAPGIALPREATLAAQLGISVGTLRHAVDELVFEQILIRRQGKGTYVALHNDERFLFQFFHIEARPDDGARPGVARTRPSPFPEVTCIGFERGRADASQAAALGLRVGEPVLLILNRLSLVGQPVAQDRICVAAAPFRGLTERRFTERPGTIYALYQSAFAITVLRATERARAVPCPADAARVLGLRAGTPVMEIHRIALSFNDRPVEYRITTVNTAGHDYVSERAKG